MIFKALSLKNIRSYKDTKIKFPSGISLFEGDIGSGKSTILMAIEFVLFGLGNQKGESLLRRRTYDGSVTLEFEVNGQECEIRRNLVRIEKEKKRKFGKNEIKKYVRQEKGYFSLNGVKDILSPSEIKEKVLNILDFKEPIDPLAQSVIFRYAVYTPQEEMKYILSQKPKDRLKTLRKAFGIEDYKIAIENASSCLSRVKDDISFLKGKTADLDNINNDLIFSREEKSFNQNKLSEFLEEYKKIELIFNEQKDRLELLRESEMQLKNLLAEIPHLKRQIEDKKQLCIKYNNEIRLSEEENNVKLFPQIEKIEKIQSPTSENEENLTKKINYLKKLTKNRAALEVNLNLLNENKENIENEITKEKNKSWDSLEKEKEVMNYKMGEWHDLLKSKEENVKKFSEKRFKLEVKKTDILETLNNLEELGDFCPVCGSPLDDKHKKNIKNEGNKEINKLELEIQKLTEIELKYYNELESVKIDINKLQNDLEDFKVIMDKISRLNELKTKVNLIKSDLRRLSEQLILVIDGSVEFDKIDDYVDYFEGLLNQLRDFKKSQEDLMSIKSQFKRNTKIIEENKITVKNLEIEIKELDEILNDAEAKTRKLKSVAEEIETLKHNHEKTNEKLQLLKENIISTETMINSLQNDIKKLKNIIKEKKELLTHLNEAKDRQILFNDSLIPTFFLIEKDVMNEKLGDFNDNFKSFFDVLNDDISKEVEINEEFTPIIKQDGYFQDVNYLSGGEKTSVALAYRLALNKTVQKSAKGLKSNLLILDEPTDGFSSEQLDNVKELLSDLDFNQIIIVSHERQLASFVDNSFRVEKVNGNSKVEFIT